MHILYISALKDDIITYEILQCLQYTMMQSNSGIHNKLDLAEFIIKNNVRSHLELMSIAAERNEAGDRELAKFIFQITAKTR